ncbi:MAG: hypothetical protein RL038_949, partial [Actinomycetota bacterium]
MTDEIKDSGSTEPTKAVKRPRRAASRPAGPPVVSETSEKSKPEEKPAKVSTRAPRAAKAEEKTEVEAKRNPRKKVRGGQKPAATPVESVEAPVVAEETKVASKKSGKVVPLAAVFQPADEIVKESKASRNKPVTAEVGDAGEATETRSKPNRNRKRGRKPELVEATADNLTENESTDTESEKVESDENESAESRRRRRRRGGRGRNRREDGNDEANESADADGSESDSGDAAEVEGDSEGSSTRRRRRRRGAGDDAEEATSTARGSTRLEAKKQRRRDGRDAGRRRAPILSEAEFLARRENVNRVMALREVDDRVQIAVLEDDILVEHYVNKTSGSSLIGNVYLGRIQNVLPSMEAAFVDIGKGRNAVLYAGEVNWDA